MRHGVATVREKHWRVDTAAATEDRLSTIEPQIVLSFDVEEHDRIEAAAGLRIDPALRAHYAERLGPSTHWLLDQLARFDVRCTFFIVGQIARSHPAIVRATCVQWLATVRLSPC